MIVLTVSFLALSLVNSAATTPNKNVYPVFELFRSLDINTLSRLLAFHSKLYNSKYPRNPTLEGKWVYKENKVWPERLNTYGYGIAVEPARGDGSCMFNSLSLIFQNHGLKKKDFKKFVSVENTPISIYHAIMNILEGDGFLKPFDLKLISNISFIGMDPNLKESLDHFDPSRLINNLKRFIDTGSYEDEVTRKKYVDETKITVGWNPKKYYDALTKGNDPKKTAKDLYNVLSKLLVDRWGDYYDLNMLEDIFGFKSILFNDYDNILNCSFIEDSNPNFFVTLYYYNMCHFDVAGIFQLAETEPVIPKSLFMVNDLPTFLAVILTDDCRLQMKDL